MFQLHSLFLKTPCLCGSSDADDIAGCFIRLNVEPLISVLAGYQFTIMLVNHVDAVPQFPRHFPRIGCFGEAVRCIAVAKRVAFPINPRFVGS